MQARTTFIITWDKLNRMKGMSGERNRLKDKCVGFTLASGSEVATKWNTPHLTLTSSGCKTCEKHEKSQSPWKTTHSPCRYTVYSIFLPLYPPKPYTLDF